MPDTSRSPDAVLRICAQCDPARFGPALERLRATLVASDLAGRVAAVEQACFNACDAPVSVSLQGPDRATYFFRHVDPESDAEDILATLRVYLSSPDGWIEDARPCGRLRHCLMARVPAL